MLRNTVTATALRVRFLAGCLRSDTASGGDVSAGPRSALRRPQGRTRRLQRLAATCLLGLCAAIALPVTAASAGPLVDPSGFVPAPPTGAECREHGASVLCRTRFTFVFEAEPVVEAPCGTIYENAQMPRNIYTEYVDGLLVGRHVTSHVTGTWSLDPTGAEPNVRIHSGWNWRTELTVPGDESTSRITTHGNQLRLSNGLSRYANISGIFYPDGDYHGTFIDTIFSEAESQQALCDALIG